MPAHGATPQTRTALLRAINVVRASHGLRPFRADRFLTEAARAHTTDMLRNDYFDHGDFAGRMLAFHVRGSLMGEDLAWGNGSYARASAIVRQWLQSPEHRANLLDPRFGRVGLGVARGSFQGAANAMVVTADFAG